MVKSLALIVPNVGRILEVLKGFMNDLCTINTSLFQVTMFPRILQVNVLDEGDPLWMSVQCFGVINFSLLDTVH